MKILLKIHKSCFKFDQLIHRLPSQPCPIGNCSHPRNGRRSLGKRNTCLVSLPGPTGGGRRDLGQMSRERGINHNP